MDRPGKEVLAGRDGEDSRQGHTPADVPIYTEALSAADLAGLKIGVVAEGFGLPTSEPDVDETVRSSAASLAELGAEVRNVSVPLHAQAGAVTFGNVVDAAPAHFMS